MTKKVYELKETDDARFHDALNDVIADHEEDGWELVDTDFSSSYDPELDRFYSAALLTFEK